MEVSLARWLVGDLDDSMNGYTRWPPDTKPISQLVKNQAPYNEKWDKFKVQVMKYYDTFPKALAAVPKFVADSTYETEDPEIPVKRRRIRTQRFDSSSEDDVPAKASVKSIKPPPAIKAKPNQLLSRAVLTTKDKEAIIEKLKQAKATVAAKTKSPSKGSPWKVTAQDNDVSPQKCKKAASATSPRNSLRTPDATPEKSQQAASSSRDHVRTPTPFLESAPASPHISPACSTQPSPVGSTQGDVIHHKDRMDCGFETGEEDDNLDTPIMTPYKSPPKRSQSTRLTRSNAFCYSPKTAAAYTADLHERVARKADGSGTSELRGVRNLFPSSKSKEGETASLDDRLRRIEETQHRVSAKLDLMLMNVGRLHRSLLPGEKKISKPHNMPDFPLRSKDDLKIYEKFLGDSNANLSAVCDYMSNSIKLSVPDPERKSGHAILTEMLSNRFAEGINLDGGNGKIGFRSLKLYKVYQATLKNAFPDSDLSVGEDALQKWLKDAKWRKDKLRPATDTSTRVSKGKSSRTRETSPSRSSRRPSSSSQHSRISRSRSPHRQSSRRPYNFSHSSRDSRRSPASSMGHSSRSSNNHHSRSSSNMHRFSSRTSNPAA